MRTEDMFDKNERQHFRKITLYQLYSTELEVPWFGDAVLQQHMATGLIMESTLNSTVV